MKIVKIIGGLGNQMSQYAFALALKHRYDDVKIDTQSYLKSYKLHNGFELSHIFNLDIQEATNKEIKQVAYSNNLIGRIQKKFFNFKKEITCFDTFYHPEILNIKGDRYYAGYWGSEKYFIDIKDTVLKAFSFKHSLDTKNNALLQKIQATNSISIHIRRGDYISSEINKAIYGNICTLEYYQQAISFIHSKIEHAHFFIFSNDIPWCMNNIKLQNASFVDWNTGNKSYIDMQLMSYCKGNIIANSSFSWWGAWLNKNPQKIVVAPSKFFNDILPSDINTILPKDWYKIGNNPPPRKIFLHAQYEILLHYTYHLSQPFISYRDYSNTINSQKVAYTFSKKNERYVYRASCSIHSSLYSHQ